MKKILIILFLLLAGCSQVPEKIVVKPVEPKQMSYMYLKILAIMCMERYDTGDKTTEEVMTELALAEYKLSVE